MLRFFQSYHKSAIGLFVAVLICISMLGFGVGLGGQNRSDYVVKVNEQEVSPSSFYDQRRSMMAQYRQLFGDNFFKFDQKQMQRIYEQFVDSLIDRLVLNQFASNHDVFVGETELRRHLQENVFGGSFSPAVYRNYLQQIGKSGMAFEAQLQSDLLQQTISDMIDHSSRPSEAEALALLKDAETLYDVNYLEIDPKLLLEKVAEPSEDELEKYYTDNGVDFEKDPRVKYDYVGLESKEYLDQVEIQEEDIELYYAEHQKKFRTPETRKASHIQLTYPAEASTEQLTELKEKALLVHSRATAGEDFQALVQEYSDDIPTKVNNGSLGTLKKGDQAAALDSAIFALEESGIAKLVEVDYGFHIINVEEIIKAGVKDIKEVRGEIETAIRKREAPAYMLAHAEDLFAEWRKSPSPLKDFAASKNLVASATSGLLGKQSDPATGLRGLTGNVLSRPEQSKQIVELSDQIVLVEIEDIRDAEVPPLAEIKKEVIAAWKNKKAQELAASTASKLSESLKDEEIASIAGSNELEVKNQKDLKPGSAFGIFGNPEVRAALFRGIAKNNPALERYFEVEGKFYLFSIASVTEPDQKTLDEKLESYRSRAGARLAQNLRTSIINRLKAESEIEIRPGAMS